MLRYACQYSFQEFMKLLSDVWLAADLGWISIPREKLLEEMCIRDRVGALEGRAVAAHCVYVDDTDMQILAKHGVGCLLYTSRCV